MPAEAQPPLANGFRYMQGFDPMLYAIKEAVRVLENVDDLTALTSWVRGPLRAIIRHEKTILGFGSAGYSLIRIDRTHAVDLPNDYFTPFHKNTEFAQCPVMVSWLRSHGAKIVLPEKYCTITERDWHESFKLHRLVNGLFDATTHGPGNRMCFIALFNIPRNFEGAINLLDKFITPALPAMWQRIEATELNGPAVPKPIPALKEKYAFTDAEKEIIYWLGEGKSNWVIAHVLEKSQSTVKTQIQHMLRKTGLKDRHALAESGR